MKSKYKQFEDVMDFMRFHAGEWHDATCNFPEVDHAVCNCNLPANKRTVRAFFI